MSTLQKAIATLTILFFGLTSVIFAFSPPKGRSYWPFVSYPMYSVNKKDVTYFKEFTYYGVFRDQAGVYEKELTDPKYLAPFDRDSFRKAIRLMRDKHQTKRLRLGMKKLFQKNIGPDLIAFKIYLDKWRLNLESNFDHALPEERKLILQESMN